MQKRQYPQAQCKEVVWSRQGSGQAYPCELPNWHPGPCGSFSVPQSVEARDAWEAENPDWQQNLGTGDFIVDKNGNLT
jgi:hypothetical protein